MILADKIIYLRKKAGWSQEELAEKMEVSRQSISKWEGALSVPDMNRILKLSELFDVSTDYLLRDEMEEEEKNPEADEKIADETGEKLVYVTDTMYLPYRFRGITHWMIECNNDLEAMEANVEAGTLNRGLKHRIQRSHMSIETLLGIFQANDMAQAEQIYLLHLSDDNSREAEFLDRVIKATGAQVIVC